MKKILAVFALLLAYQSSAHAARYYGNEIAVDPLPVRKVLKLMNRDTTGSTPDQAITNAENLCEIYIRDIKKQGGTVYSYRAYATSTASGYVWYGNCEASVK